jgi:hypothetical protein
MAAQDLCNPVLRLWPACIDRLHLQEPIQVGRKIGRVSGHCAKGGLCADIGHIQRDMVKIGPSEQDRGLVEKEPLKRDAGILRNDVITGAQVPVRVTLADIKPVIFCMLLFHRKFFIGLIGFRRVQRGNNRTDRIMPQNGVDHVDRAAVLE